MQSSARTRTVMLGFLRAAVIGVAGGLASLGFRSLTNYIQEGIGVTRYLLAGARQLDWWQLLAIPLSGALCAALVVRFVVRSSGGTGLTDVMEAVSVRKGDRISLRSALARALASLGIIATGGSVGREGPIITIASAASSWLTRVLRAPARDRGLLLGCGVAAGFAAAYNAPIAGAIFALEVVLGNFAMEVFAPVVVASVSSMLFTHYVGQGPPIYGILHGEFRWVSALECGPYLLLGLIAGFAAVAFQWMIANSGRWFARIPGPRVVSMAVGGLIIGAFALVFPEVWGNGYETVTEILGGDFTGASASVVTPEVVDPLTVHPTGPRLGPLGGYELAGMLALLALVKLIATTVTVGSGGAGGVFTPTLFIGAALGGAFGQLVNTVAPHPVGPLWGYAIVGMGCLVAGTTRAPVMAIVVIFEMTQDYDIVLPLMLGCITSSVVAKRLYPHSIYEEKLAERGTLPPQGLEENMLVTTQVGDVMRSDPDFVLPSLTYDRIVPLMTNARTSVIYVCTKDMQLRGVIRLHDLVDLASMGDLGPTIIAADLMVPLNPVTADQSLASVLELYEVYDLGELPVVAGHEDERLVGCVTRRDVMSAMHFEILKRQNLRAKFVHREDVERADYVELARGSELARVPILPEHAGLTVREASVRGAFGINIVNVIRFDPDHGESRITPDADFVFAAGDELIVIGDEEQLARWRAAAERPADGIDDPV